MEGVYLTRLLAHEERSYLEAMTKGLAVLLSVCIQLLSETFRQSKYVISFWNDKGLTN